MAQALDTPLFAGPVRWARVFGLGAALAVNVGAWTLIVSVAPFLRPPPSV